WYVLRTDSATLPIAFPVADVHALRLGQKAERSAESSTSARSPSAFFARCDGGPVCRLTANGGDRAQGKGDHTERRQASGRKQGSSPEQPTAPLALKSGSLRRATSVSPHARAFSAASPTASAVGASVRDSARALSVAEAVTKTLSSASSKGNITF